MAKREIKRQVEETETVEVTGQVEETKTVDSAINSDVEEALPAEKRAHPVAAKPLDVTVTMKSPGTFVVRVWSGAVLFAGRGKMNKVPIVPGKPVNIRITQ